MVQKKSAPAPIVAGGTEAPWEQLPKETDKAFHQFKIYLNLAPPRSIRKAYWAYKGVDPLPAGEEPSHVRSLASKHRWHARAEAWTRHNERVKHEAKLDESRKAAVKTEKKRADLREREMTLAVLLMDKVEQMLQVPILSIKETITEKVDDDGRAIVIKNIIHPAKWRMSDVAKLLDIASKVARLSADMETDRVVINGFDERRKRIEELLKDPDMAAAAKVISERMDDAGNG